MINEQTWRDLTGPDGLSDGLAPHLLKTMSDNEVLARLDRSHERAGMRLLTYSERLIWASEAIVLTYEARKRGLIAQKASA
jgi:hypothetical protein